MYGKALANYDPIGDAASEILGLYGDTSRSSACQAAEIIRKHLNKPPALQLHADNAGYEIISKHWAIQRMAESVQHTLDQFGGNNYATFELQGGPKGPLVVTIQYKHGKSPAEVQDELIRLLRDVLDRGLAKAEQEAAIDRACKWLYDHDTLAAEKDKNVAEYKAADEKVRRKIRRWWPNLFRRGKR